MCDDIDKEVILILVSNQYIKVKVNATTIDYYNKLGYESEMNKSLLVKAEDLSSGSQKDVKIICDYCGKEFTKKYDKFLKQRKFIQKDACYDCFGQKEKDVCLIKYGVSSVTQLSEIKNKTKSTLIEKYGVNSPMQLDEIKDKFKDTMLNKYGCEYAQQNKDIRQKTKDHCIEKYGVDYPIVKPDIKEKSYNSRIYINGIMASRKQIQIANFIEGAINTNIIGYYVDITLINKKIAIEYNGSGHNLNVQNNQCTQTEFDLKEKERINNLILNGWKCLIIENSTDKKLSIRRLNNIKEQIFKLQNSDEDYIKYTVS